MTERYIQIEDLQVAGVLADFINRELLPRLDCDAGQFWVGFASLIRDLTPRNLDLIEYRDHLQSLINGWHMQRRGQPMHQEDYRQFLRMIGYLQDSGEDFEVGTTNVDDEIAVQAGPQLVVPVKNARFALNAANARWGSLYDALYGSDAIDESDGAGRRGGYNPVRGAKVIAFAREFLDQACPLTDGSFTEVTGFTVVDGRLRIATESGAVGLAEAEKFRGYRGDPTDPQAILLCNHDLHIEIQLDRNSPIGRQDRAGIKDLLLEAAVTTIQDCEDSVAAVDAEDKVEVYRNWLGLIVGDLQETFVKGGQTLTRSLHPDREYQAPNGDRLTLPGRSLLLIRNVGHMMPSTAIMDAEDFPVYEGIMDAVITCAIASLDVRGRTRLRNSRRGSIYVVKPKMHGPDEVEFACDLYGRVEQLLGLPENTVKLGIMDEERRTTVNLKECIRRARDRVMFINTGFLDRTGDEIHTSMEAGPMVPKAAMKDSVWINAYEDNNVDVGLACGLPGHAQIGKGMWAMPDLMGRMLQEKIAHPRAGASTAWVPSPTAAVLHALHYHQVDVKARHQILRRRRPPRLEELLTLPLLEDPGSLSAEEIQKELDNNAQSILG
jgi:malate synthase